LKTSSRVLIPRKTRYYDISSTVGFYSLTWLKGRRATFKNGCVLEFDFNLKVRFFQRYARFTPFWRFGFTAQPKYA